MLRTAFIAILLFFAIQAGAQTLRPASDTAARAPVAAYLLTAPAGTVAPGGYYQQHFGFFCKKEWAWEKRTGVPLKLRLGNYEYAQRQEGK